ncbi:MAG TPA: cell division protein ZapB [Acidobacteriota bacterium]|nr:cell division protein ZapB [Acidobacteriota bacterium]
MDFQQLEVLEQKIKKLIAALKALRGENETLTRKNEEQEKAIRQLKLDLERWAKSAEENESLQQQIDAMNKERDQVRTRLETLVSHLEDLEARL